MINYCLLIIFKILKTISFFENNFLHGCKRDTNGKIHYTTCMQHEMPQSLLVFAVSLTPEIPNFGTFGGVAHPF